jgi:hypothetical protein
MRLAWAVCIWLKFKFKERPQLSRSVCSMHSAEEVNDHGEEGVRQKHQEAGEVGQDDGADAARRRKRAAHRRAGSGQVFAVRRAVVETVPARLTGTQRTRGSSRRSALWLVCGLSAVLSTALLLLASPVLTGRAVATMVVSKDFAALCDEADMIFVGTVTDLESRWADSSRQAIETLVTFSDLTWIYGTPRSAVTLRFSGGEIDGLHEEIAGLPQFERGERRVIFARDGRYVSPIVGFDQGALRVVDAVAGPAVIGVEPPAGPGAALRLGSPESTSTVPIDVFIDRVRERVATRTPAAP